MEEQNLKINVKAEETVLQPVQIVTIKNKHPLLKNEEKAKSVELLELVEFGYKIVSQIDLYQVGQRAVLILPDYCLSDLPIFNDYIAPDGDPTKSKLGSKNRVKAVKFRLHTGNGQLVYSYGILLSYASVSSYLNVENLSTIDLVSALGITKYEEPDESINDGSSEMPKYLYRTDEVNIMNIKENIKFPITLIGTQKIDGSSITVFATKDDFGVCSRNKRKPFVYEKLVKVRKHKWYHKILKWLGIKFDCNVYKTVVNQSIFNKIGNEYAVILKNYCDKYDVKIALRGELNGMGAKGSGNKNNPSAKENTNIKWFGADFIANGSMSRKMSDHTFNVLLNQISKDFDIPLTRCPIVLEEQEYESFDQLYEKCEKYFQDNMVEGIVVKTPDSSFSAKVMNLAYDSKK